MSKFPILVILAAAFATSIRAAQPMKPVTVDQLAQILAHARGEKDAKIAKELSRLYLTERVSADRLAQWRTEFPGKRTRQTLIELADASAFLKLPASDLPHRPRPDLDAIRLMLNQSVAYVNKTIHGLPDFYALRTTTYFEDTSALFEDRLLFCTIPSLRSYCLSQARQAAMASANDSTPLLVAGKSTATVAYVDGKELDNGSSSVKAPITNPRAGLVTSGEFGPILIVVLGDALQGQLYWGHWEQSADGTMAVFEYKVPAAESHYVVTLPSASRQESIKPAYHGEISIDPVTGAIHRITVIADPAPPHDNMGTSMMVQYGPVVIGGKTYICPIRGVALSKTQVNLTLPGRREQQTGYITRLNDVTFTRYHLFRAEMKILPESGFHSQAHVSAGSSAR